MKTLQFKMILSSLKNRIYDDFKMYEIKNEEDLISKLKEKNIENYYNLF